jgi:uncharacterized damage-inducible protein DinB
MRSAVRLGTLSALTFALCVPVGTQERQGLMSDLIRDIDQVQKKIVGLARAMPETAYAWRPAKGVRSTSEVLAHVAADNYFLPAAMGTTAPAETGINAKDYDTTVAFEKKARTRDEVISEVEKSFAFLKTSMTSFPDAKLDAPLEAFGQKMTHRALWVSTVTHLHEHLGQLIAYARSNNVTPPWSK